MVNYGLAIILLTVLVRSAMMPLSRKAAKNAQMMQELAPEMKRIAEKYKNDMEKRGIAQRELFAKHNYNPFGGCLLMLVQLPIFIGLYRSLSVDIELLQAPLIPGLRWCSNLAGPDMLWYWEPYLFAILGDPGDGWLGPYLNVLPIITIVLFLVQQKMFMPPPTDDQTRMQQQMMKYMMVFMGVLFFRVPSGLCVYFIASSLWGIAERKMLPPPQKPDSSLVAVAPKPKPQTPNRAFLLRSKESKAKPKATPRKPASKAVRNGADALYDGATDASAISWNRRLSSDRPSPDRVFDAARGRCRPGCGNGHVSCWRGSADRHAGYFLDPFAPGPHHRVDLPVLGAGWPRATSLCGFMARRPSWTPSPRICSPNRSSPRCPPCIGSRWPTLCHWLEMGGSVGSRWIIPVDQLGTASTGRTARWPTSRIPLPIRKRTTCIASAASMCWFTSAISRTARRPCPNDRT
jgi:YidC/Oxa1 family membrane protein insertase